MQKGINNNRVGRVLIVDKSKWCVQCEGIPQKMGVANYDYLQQRPTKWLIIYLIDHHTGEIIRQKSFHERD